MAGLRRWFIIPATPMPWDVAVSGVSRLESTQRAYERYLEDRRPQRHYL